MGDRSEQRAHDDRVAGLLGGGEPSVGGYPSEVLFADLGEHHCGGLVGEREQPERLCPLAPGVLARGELGVGEEPG